MYQGEVIGDGEGNKQPWQKVEWKDPTYQDKINQNKEDKSGNQD